MVDISAHVDEVRRRAETRDLVAARREYIRNNAPCVGCGATRAACEAHRGKDPTAPPWFGCCARGTDMAPCHHPEDLAALSELLDEIEAGHVRTVEEATPKPRDRGMSWSWYFDQGEQWKPNGKPMVAVVDMDPEWRLNASRFLERNAAGYAAKCSLDAVAADPVTWIRTTALYRALVAGLPTSPDETDKLAARARHWSTCPARSGSDECRCEQIAAQCQRCRDGRDCLLCHGTMCGWCPDCSPQVPEWTT
jgi:hypothetical protein